MRTKLTIDLNSSRDSRVVENHLFQYLLDMNSLQSVASDVKRYLEFVLDEQAIKYHLVEARSKSFESYEAKAGKVLPDGSPKYLDLPRDIHDCVAARIIVFTSGDKSRAVEEFRQRFLLVDGEDKNPGAGRKHPSETGWGYDSHHFVVRGLADAETDYQFLTKFLEDRKCFEIQVRTVAAHAWAEYEHDVRYKPQRLKIVSEHDQGRVKELFNSAAEARQTIDQKFAEIESILQSMPNDSPPVDPENEPTLVSTKNDDELTSEALQSFLTEIYPDARPSQESAISWMLRVLSAAGISSIARLKEILSLTDAASVAELMEYRSIPSRIRRLDDELLSGLGAEYVAQTSGIADDDIARKRRQRYLPARHNRLTGKLGIYSVQVSSQLEFGPMTAAAAVRALVGILLEKDGLSALEIAGLASSDRGSFTPSARANLWKFESGDMLWLNGNLSRSSAEEYMKLLVSRIDSDAVKVLRAGDNLFDD